MKYVRSLLLVFIIIFALFGCKNNPSEESEKTSSNIDTKQVPLSDINKQQSAYSSDLDKLIVAHRGASGYVPEHTIASKVLAFQMGSQLLEQDLAMTKDDRLIVIHDRFLDRVTNVADIFPDRAREDGRFYVIDFTLDEIKSLTFSENFKIENGEKVQIFEDRFPRGKSTFEIHTLEEEIELIQGLNKVFGKDVGLYVETKAPWFHKQEGKDISKATLEVLKKYGYTTKDSNVYFQTFDLPDLIYVKEKLMPEMNMDLKTVFLFASNDWNETYEQQEDGTWTAFDFDALLTEEGMQKIAKYADGVSHTYDKIIDREKSTKDNLIITDFVKLAHDNNMVVHPYTINKENLPSYVNNIEELFEIILYKAGADGVFTDFPDLGINVVQNHK